MIQSEASIQQSIVLWYRNTYCLAHYNPRCMIFSVPNESNAARVTKLIATGLYSGCADLIVCHKREPTCNMASFPTWLFVEVKIPNGKQSNKQFIFETHCKQMGLQYAIVRSLEEFKQVIFNL